MRSSLSLAKELSKNKTFSNGTAVLLDLEIINGRIYELPF